MNLEEVLPELHLLHLCCALPSCALEGALHPLSCRRRIQWSDQTFVSFFFAAGQPDVVSTMSVHCFRAIIVTERDLRNEQRWRRVRERERERVTESAREREGETGFQS